MTVHFIRHGKTEANEKQLYCGSTDLPLSISGRNELQNLKMNGTYPEEYFYITSGMKRANETLELLYNKQPDMEIKDFKEFNFGSFEMKSHKELKNDLEYCRWVEGFCEGDCPGGENMASFEGRIRAALQGLRNLNRDCVLVCHGGVIGSIMNILFPSQKKFYEWQPDCGRGYSVELLTLPRLIAEIPDTGRQL